MGREGGTWLAINTSGGCIKFGALLNITGEPHSKQSLGRGFLIGNYVQGTVSNEEYSHELLQDADDKYNAFSLVTVEIK